MLKSVLPPPVSTPLERDEDYWIKLEREQITGSIKYRLVYDKLTRALHTNKINRQTVLTEVTAGSTGIALAYAGQCLGLRVELHTYDHAAADKCERIEQMGATLVRHPNTTPFPTILGQVIGQSRQGSHWHLNQFDRASNILAYQALGLELLSQIRQKMRAPPTYLVCPVGTGGIIQGVGQVLRQIDSQLHIVAVEPAAKCNIDGMRNTDEIYMGDADPYDRRFANERQVVQPPSDRLLWKSATLGLSATVAVLLARGKNWKNALIIAPD